MATLRPRKTQAGKTRWQAIVRLKGHPPVVGTFTNKTNARKWSEQIESQIRANKYLPRRAAEQHTLAEAIDRYVSESLPDLSEVERRKRAGTLGWWRNRLGEYSLAALSPGTIADARDALLRGEGPKRVPVSGPTTNRYLAALSVVLDRSWREWGWLDSNPVRAIKRKPENPGKLRYLTVDEKNRLLEACRKSREPRLYPLVLFALITGARQGELLGLSWKDVELKREPPRAVLSKTKNKDRRSIVFGGLASEVLRSLARTPHISGFVLADRRGKCSFPREAWLRALAEARVDDFRFHDLRHTAASYMAMQGATVPELAAFLGHRTLAMVQRYSHLSESHSETVATRMAEKYFA